MISRSAVLLLALSACSTSSTADGGPADGGTTDAATHDGSVGDAGPTADAGDASSIDSGVVCNGHDAASFPTFDRACAGDSDCAVALHQTDCCGSHQALGIAASEGARFAAAEAACDTMYPACGCDSGNVVTDDGSSAPPGSGASAVIVHCVSSVCTTTVRAAAPCGAVTCAPTQVCVQECSGIPRPDAGPLPSHCVDVPESCAASSSCSCFGTASPCPTGMCVSVDHGMPLCLCA